MGLVIFGAMNSIPFIQFLDDKELEITSKIFQLLNQTLKVGNDIKYNLKRHDKLQIIAEGSEFQPLLSAVGSISISTHIQKNGISDNMWNIYQLVSKLCNQTILINVELLTLIYINSEFSSQCSINISNFCVF